MYYNIENYYSEKGKLLRKGRTQSHEPTRSF